jgi:hypothetical protein
VKKASAAADARRHAREVLFIQLNAKGESVMRATLKSVGAVFCIVVFSYLVVGSVKAQPRFNVGDRVECDWVQNGRYEIGTLVPFTSTDLDTASGRWFRVKLDKDTIPGSTVECMANRLRPSASTAPAPGAARTDPSVASRPASNPIVAPRPQPVNTDAPRSSNGQLPPLPGTAWKIDYGRGKTGDVFLFCSTGTWEIVSASGRIGAVGRSYRVSGSSLTTVNRDDGKVQTWRMNGNNGLLVINDGRQTLTLHYNGTTQCR